MIKTRIIPDSSFFLCFFKDLKGILKDDVRLDYLSRISISHNINVTPIVEDEIKFYDGYETLKDFFISVNMKEINALDNMIEPLRPLYSKGEYEVIIVAYNLKDSGINFKFILDDKEAREIIEKTIQELKPYMTGTIGIVGYCCTTQLFNNEETIDLLLKIKSSGFRITPSIIDGIIAEINARC